MSITLNGLRVVSLRVVHPWRGVPFLDVDMDPDIVSTAPLSGPAVIVIGTPPVVTLLGVIDPLAAGIFVADAKVRVIAGKGGWSKSVPAQHFIEPSGQLLSTTVYQATATLVLETVIDQIPALFGADYARSKGRASRIFDRVDYWVDLVTGVTTVGLRPPAVADPTLEILSFDPLTQTAELVCDTLIVPGTLLSDPLRLGPTPLIVRSVEQFFDETGSHATAWCSTAAVERLQAALRTMVQEFGEIATARVYRYRFVSQGPSPTQAILQAVERDPLTGAAAPMPDLVPAAEWTGVAGCTALLPPSLEVLVQFLGGDPTLPRIVGYSTLALPLQVTTDATASVNVGPTAPLVSLGGGAAPIVPTPWATALATALATLATALGSAASFANVAAAGSALGSDLGSLPPAATTRVKAT